MEPHRPLSELQDEAADCMCTRSSEASYSPLTIAFDESPKHLEAFLVTQDACHPAALRADERQPHKRLSENELCP